MTPTLQAVNSRLKKRGLNAELQYYPGIPPRISIPAKNAITGGITVFEEPNELTVGIEGKHHSHFQTPEEAADFVADIITERICITVDYLGNHCIGSSYFYLDQENVTVETIRDSMVGQRGGNIQTNRYLWSGPVSE